MQPVARGESRARRTTSAEPRSRRRSPSTVPSVLLPQHPLISLFTVLAFFAAPTSLSPVLLAFPVAFLSALFLLLLARPTPTAFRLLTRRCRPAIPPLVFLHVYQIAACLTAARLVGPVCALIAIGAHPSFVCAVTISPTRRRTAFSALMLCVALTLLVFDAAGGRTPVSKPSIVRDHVHNRILNISSISKTFNSLHLKYRRRHPPPSLSTHVEQPVLPAHPPPSVAGPQPATENHNSTNLQSGPGVDANHPDENRRRLLAVVESETLHPPQKALEHSSSDENSSSVNTNSSFKNGPDSHPVNGTSGGTVSSPRQGGDASIHAELSDIRSQYTLWSSVSAASGIFLAITSSFAARTGAELRDTLVSELGDWPNVVLVLYLSTSFFLFPFFVTFCAVTTTNILTPFRQFAIDILPKTFILSLTLLVIPALLQMHRKGLLRTLSPPSHRSFKSTPSETAAFASYALRDVDVTAPNTAYLYFFSLCTMMVIRLVYFPSRSYAHSLSFASCISALIFLTIPKLDASKRSTDSRIETSILGQRPFASSSSDLFLYFGKSSSFRLRKTWKLFKESTYSFFSAVREFFAHARSNKASWQVLSFLILQCFMAVMEFIYATLTDSTGLFSISADNFFCTVALAIGLFAIRASSRKPSAMSTYGFSRIESLCGFTNGIMLIYVAILIVLESFERLASNNDIAVGRAFSVCLFGISGNVLGLYFFPPETRRENHNVQGIYLHIIANTLAFASMAVSAAISAVIPEWKVFDLATAISVAISIIVLSIPLIDRSARLLVLMVPLEKEGSLVLLKQRLSEMNGVVTMSALRVWSLTPTSVVASVRLEVSSRYSGSDAEVLAQARSVFSMMDIPASQCTIEISRVEETLPEATVFLHKRTRSGFADTGINFEALPNISRQKSEIYNSNDVSVLTL